MPVAKRKTTKKTVRSKVRPKRTVKRRTKVSVPVQIARTVWNRFAPKTLKKWAWMVKGMMAAGVAIAIAFGVTKVDWKVSDKARLPAAVHKTALEKEFDQLAGQALEKRLEYWSDKIQNNPSWMKGFDTLANTKQPVITDSAALIPEKFNCTTYVETVIALAKSKTPSDFYGHLIKIRYQDSKTDYFSRNHFPEADWIPNNTEAGLLRDVTRITGLSAKTASESQTKVIDRGRWFDSKVAQGQVNRKLASAVEATWREPVRIDLPYIKTQNLYGQLDQIQGGTVVNLVRLSKPKYPVMITHQGFAFHGKDGVTYFRHSTPQGEIKTNKMAEYLKSVTDHSPKSWPMVGLNFNQVLDN